MVETRGLRKTYGDVAVLNAVDLEVPAGTVLALLGSNGAGKTTVVKILRPCSSRMTAPRASTGSSGVAAGAGAGVDQPDRAVRGGGRDADRAGEPRHDRQAATRQEPAPGRGRSARTLRPGRAADRRVSTYSGGMRRRLDIAMSLIGDHGSSSSTSRPQARPGSSPRGLADGPRARRRRYDGIPHHAVSGGGREACRPDRHPARGQDHRVRHAGGAEEAVPAR